MALQGQEFATISTHFMLPFWWVKAYEAAALAQAHRGSAMDRVLVSGLSPALSVVELNALAVVLGSLQSQILSKKGISDAELSLSLDVEEHLRHAGISSRSRQFVYERVMQLLPALRVLSPHENSDFLSHPFFQNDHWRHEPSLSQIFIDLLPAKIGAELILGYSEAFADLARLARGESEGAGILGEQAPLALWRSIWLDLQGAEQLLFLRLEQAIQWEHRWMQLGGVFGTSLHHLFTGIQLPEGRSDRPPLSELARRLRVIARLGGKLCGHGLLMPMVADQYLAVEEAGEHELQLIWQVGRERLFSEAPSVYLSAVASYFQRCVFPTVLPLLARLCSAEDHAESAQRFAARVWQAIQDIEVPASCLVGLMHGQTQIILPHGLYIELSLRQAFGSRFSLPAEIAAGPLADLLAQPHEVDFSAGFRNFLAMLDGAPDLAKGLREIHFATLTSPVTRQDSSFSKWVKQCRGDDAAPQIKAKVEDAPASKAAAAAEPLETSEAPEVSKASAVSGALASRMRRIATDELDKLRATFPERYHDLRRAYLSSLDELGRRLILDVQKRMQPAIFEEHLRQRLVRYMVDNPGAWRSADTHAKSQD